MRRAVLRTAGVEPPLVGRSAADIRAAFAYGLEPLHDLSSLLADLALDMLKAADRMTFKVVRERPSLCHEVVRRPQLGQRLAHLVTMLLQRGDRGTADGHRLFHVFEFALQALGVVGETALER